MEEINVSQKKKKISGNSEYIDKTKGRGQFAVNAEKPSIRSNFK